MTPTSVNLSAEEQAVFDRIAELLGCTRSGAIRAVAELGEDALAQAILRRRIEAAGLDLSTLKSL